MNALVEGKVEWRAISKSDIDEIIEGDSRIK